MLKDLINKVQKFLFFIILLKAQASSIWKPPIGIPTPEFGIEETHSMYKGKLFQFGSVQKVYPDAGYGPYTHYIDSKSANATDTDNPYGSPQKPRITVPTTFEPGSVVEVHGHLSTTKSQIIWRVNGTKDKPVFIRGVSKSDRPILENRELLLTGQYCVLENFEFSGTSVAVRTFQGDEQTHHIAVRSCESHTLSKTAMTAVSTDTTKKTNNVVFYNNYLHGDAFNPNDTGFKELDACGVYLSPRSDKVWIIDNHIHTFTGDAVGGGHGAKYSVSNYFIGRNDLHTCGENAIDTKEVENIIISQNKMHDMMGWSSGSNGTAAVVHYGPTLSSKNVWFIANDIYECQDVGIQIGGDQQYDVYIIGNIIRNIKNSNKTGCAYRTWSSKKVHFVNNTVYNVDIGVKSDVNTTDAILLLKNNIFSNVSETMLTMSGVWHLSNSIIMHNLFYNYSNKVKFNWGGQEYTSLLLFKANSRTCDSCWVEDPLFIDPDNGNFELANDSLKRSPAIDRGTLFEYDTLFMSLFNTPLIHDYDGNLRHFDGDSDGIVKIDIGCYENVGVSGFGKAPTKFRIKQ